MKISDPSGRPVSGVGPSVGPASGTRSASRAAGSATGDQIQLSHLMAHLSESGSPEHAARLSNLGQIVSKGQYQVDSSAVSEAIIQDSLTYRWAA